MRLPEQFIGPSTFGPYNLSCVPGTILSTLTPETPKRILPDDALSGMSNKYDKVVVFLLDAFGWSYFEQFARRSGFLKELCERGNAMKLSTQFPSATACNITTMNTGLDVAQHGVFEWFYYEPKVGEIIAPMLYSYIECIHDRDSLKNYKGLNPADIYPRQTFYKKLLEHGVMSYTFQDRNYAVSTYSDFVFEGAQRYGYVSPADGLINLAHAVVNEPKKSYYYFYFDKIDTISHVYGTESKELKAELDVFFLMLEEVFWKNVKDKVDRTLFILTADHGQTPINPDKCVYLNLEFPELEKFLRMSKCGRPLVPAGSCRDMFLYVKDEYIDEAQSFLSEKLHDKAAVVRTRDLIDGGYFGEKYVSEALAGRLGNLVILPFQGESVWWYDKGVFEITFLGHHGGLTRQEMEIPFLAWEL